VSDINDPGSPSDQPPPAYAPPAQAPGSPAPGAYTTPTGQVPERLGGVYYSPGLVILLSIVTLGIWTFLWVYRTGEDLKRYNGDGLGGVLNVVLNLLLGIVLMFTIPNEIKNMYERDGRQSPVSAIWGLWFLLPIIGLFVWYFKVQRSLNDFWLSKGAMAG
jgi:hypothetical protein